MAPVSPPLSHCPAGTGLAASAAAGVSNTALVPGSAGAANDALLLEPWGSALVVCSSSRWRPCACAREGHRAACAQRHAPLHGKGWPREGGIWVFWRLVMLLAVCQAGWDGCCAAQRRLGSQLPIFEAAAKPVPPLPPGGVGTRGLARCPNWRAPQRSRAQHRACGARVWASPPERHPVQVLRQPPIAPGPAAGRAVRPL